MMGLPRVMLVFLLGNFLLISLASAMVAASGTTDSAFLVVNKQVTMSHLKDGEKVTVNFGIYNMGGGAAYDVTLIDSAWLDSSFEVLSGNTTTSWVKLEGGAMVEHSFVLKTTTKGPYVTPPATVTYRQASRSSIQKAKSTPVSSLHLLASREPEVLVDIKAMLVGAAPLMSAITIVAGVVYIIFAPSKAANKYWAGSKKRR